MRADVSNVHIRTTRRYIPEDGKIHNYRCENLKAYSLTKYNAVNFAWLAR
jgi:hypothetical protein